ncbi:AAA family ATPase [Nitrospira sp. KM1]|uniref:AAA family ATPase n=1 Tax=Nitrospira sp. KM1 TaxID=1936990 RepID=UPI0015657E5B|nr:AAA family ATPase [Nitrospira sp. KM1]
MSPQYDLFNPSAIKRIVVEKLFGVFSYTIPAPDSDCSQLLIIYGDNGSGKTTILKLVFHLLSPESNKGHRSFVAKTPFKSLHIELENGFAVSASREDTLIGEYELRIAQGETILAQCKCITKEDFAVVAHCEGLNRVEEQLARLELTVHFLADDRRMARSVQVPRETKTVYERRYRVPGVIGAKDEDSDESRLDANLKTAVYRVTQWIRQQVLRGSSKGQEDSNTIYAHVIRQIIAKKDSSELHSGSIVETIDTLASRNNLFSEFGFIAPINIQSFKEPLMSAPSTNYHLVSRILQPYFDGIRARLDALDGIYQLVKLFVTNVNSFYTNKQIAFSLQEGLSIISADDSKLHFTMLSSGEKQLLLLFCNTLLARDKSAVFIIDEPELSLNVKWQRRLLKALLECIQGSNIQFLLATHSLEILALHRKNVAKLISDPLEQFDELRSANP